MAMARKLLDRCSLRRAHAAQETGLYGRCSLDPGTRTVAVTTIFSGLNSILLRRLFPFRDPDGLLMVWGISSYLLLQDQRLPRGLRVR
jgi:hypothetical protein